MLIKKVEENESETGMHQLSTTLGLSRYETDEGLAPQIDRKAIEAHES